MPALSQFGEYTLSQSDLADLSKIKSTPAVQQSDSPASSPAGVGSSIDFTSSANKMAKFEGEEDDEGFWSGVSSGV
jgi:hypothetical protein